MDGGQPMLFAVGGGQDEVGDAVGVVEADEIPGVAFVEQFAVRFIQSDAGVSANQSQDQVDFLRGVRSRVDGMRAAGFVLQ